MQKKMLFGHAGKSLHYYTDGTFLLIRTAHAYLGTRATYTNTLHCNGDDEEMKPENFALVTHNDK